MNGAVLNFSAFMALTPLVKRNQGLSKSRPALSKLLPDRQLNHEVNKAFDLIIYKSKNTVET
jgi:hypothetical protein